MKKEALILLILSSVSAYAVPEVSMKQTNLLFIFYLLAFNLILIIFIIILLIFLYKRYVKLRHGIGEIHPVPKELTKFVYENMKTGKTLGEIRMELAKKGWEPSMIEHAIDAAKEK